MIDVPVKEKSTGPLFSSAVFGADIPLLEEAEAVALLADIGELDLREVLDHRVKIRDESRRCRCLIVTAATNGWVVKQGANVETRETVGNEASVYRRLSVSPLVDSIPRYVYDDPISGVLVVGLASGVGPGEYQRDRPREAHTKLAVGLGHALATLQATPVTDTDVRTCPRILTCHRPNLRALEFHSPASLRALGIVQKSRELTNALDTVASAWSPVAFGHNDMRDDNIIVNEDSGRITLIDWEMAGLADPRWDLCSLLAERLAWWLSDPEAWLPEDGNVPEIAALSALVEVHRFTSGLLTGYFERAEESARFVLDSSILGWIAARLVQTAIEHCHRELTLSPLVEQMLQMAANISSRPTEAGRIFFGIEL